MAVNPALTSTKPAIAAREPFQHQLDHEDPIWLNTAIEHPTETLYPSLQMDSNVYLGAIEMGYTSSLGHHHQMLATDQSMYGSVYLQTAKDALSSRSRCGLQPHSFTAGNCFTDNTAVPGFLPYSEPLLPHRGHGQIFHDLQSTEANNFNSLNDKGGLFDSHIPEAGDLSLDSPCVRNGEESDDSSDLNNISRADGTPYAQLIYSALMSVPERRMVLKDIYRWIEDNTDKAKDPAHTGWQNSVRHNLSMNQAFRKVPYTSAREKGKRGFIWVLEDSAVSEGIQPTTRYRKKDESKHRARHSNGGSCRSRTTRQAKATQMSRRRGPNTADASSPSLSESCLHSPFEQDSEMSSEGRAETSPQSCSPFSIHTPLFLAGPTQSAHKLCDFFGQ